MVYPEDLNLQIFKILILFSSNNDMTFSISNIIVCFPFVTQTVGFLLTHFNCRTLSVYNNILRFVERRFGVTIPFLFSLSFLLRVRRFFLWKISRNKDTKLVCLWCTLPEFVNFKYFWNKITSKIYIRAWFSGRLISDGVFYRSPKSFVLPFAVR